jgi:vacuolar-type H+-ATPase subunit H
VKDARNVSKEYLQKLQEKKKKKKKKVTSQQRGQGKREGTKYTHY